MGAFFTQLNLNMKKISLKNADGSFNGKLIAGIISLLIVLVQQVLAVFGIKFAGDWTSIVAVINTILTILGMLGVITDVQTVTVSEDTTGTLERATNDVDSTSQASQAPTSAVATNVTDTSADIKIDDSKTE